MMSLLHLASLRECMNEQEMVLGIIESLTLLELL